MDKNIVYFCQNCGKVEMHSFKTQRIKCPDCGSIFASTRGKRCPEGISLEQYQEMVKNNTWEDYLIERYSMFYLYPKKLKEEKEQANLVKQNQNSAFVPKCPTCGTTDIRKISTTEKVVNIGMFGLLGNKRKYQFECLNPNCKYKW